jgi:beta-xylosidase
MNTIDAGTYIDTDGTPYLVYKTGAPDNLWVSRLTPDAKAVVPGTAVMLLPGGRPDAAFVEGPTMIRFKQQLYLFYSTDDWWTDRYRVMVAACDTPTGPCHRMPAAPSSARASMMGPGGQTPSGHEHYQRLRFPPGPRPRSATTSRAAVAPSSPHV